MTKMIFRNYLLSTCNHRMIRIHQTTLFKHNIEFFNYESLNSGAFIPVFARAFTSSVNWADLDISEQGQRL